MKDPRQLLQEILVGSCGLKAEEISVHVSLVAELGIDSIDLLDIIYGIEKEYGVPLSLAAFFDALKAECAPAPFEIDGKVTPDGFSVLRRRFSAYPQDKFPKELFFNQIPVLFTVETLARIVEDTVLKKP